MKIPSPKSKAEATLRLHLMAEKIPFSEQFRFVPTRRWRFDFVIYTMSAPFSLAIELDGGNRMVRKDKNGRSVAVGRHIGEDDMRKGHAAVMNRWYVLHFSPAMVQSGEAIRVIKECLE